VRRNVAGVSTFSIRQPARERVMGDESVDKPDIGCGRFVTRGDTH
jgi:hypothetical protein